MIIIYLIEQQWYRITIKTFWSIYQKSKTFWGKIFKALATITSRVHQLQDSAQVENVILLIDQLLEQVHDSMDLEKFSEEKRIQAYQKTRNLLVISINTTESTLASAISDLALVNEVIEQTLASLDNVNQRLEMLQQSRDDRFTICEQEAQDYQDSRSQRQ
ncbi:unnamed protein product [Paramecium primaurelia]|uniref:Uncharacterized protein n=1 Tax=Paramecium primaurelia TaxID=5886 RepID=A0A8S1QF47_PARPR|nr:unnamed protein product [Paramecium primaurelia]